MFGVIERMSHCKLLRQNKNRSLDLNIFVVSNVQLFLWVGEGSKPRNTHPLLEKSIQLLSVCSWLSVFCNKQWDFSHRGQAHLQFAFFRQFFKSCSINRKTRTRFEGFLCHNKRREDRCRDNIPLHVHEDKFEQCKIHLPFEAPFAFR